MINDYQVQNVQQVQYAHQERRMEQVYQEQRVAEVQYMNQTQPSHTTQQEQVEPVNQIQEEQQVQQPMQAKEVYTPEEIKNINKKYRVLSEALIVKNKHYTEDPKTGLRTYWGRVLAPDEHLMYIGESRNYYKGNDIGHSLSMPRTAIFGRIIFCKVVAPIIFQDRIARIELEEKGDGRFDIYYNKNQRYFDFIHYTSKGISAGGVRIPSKLAPGEKMDDEKYIHHINTCVFMYNRGKGSHRGVYIILEKKVYVEREKNDGGCEIVEWDRKSDGQGAHQ